jgi:hypothetical protein
MHNTGTSTSTAATGGLPTFAYRFKARVVVVPVWGMLARAEARHAWMELILFIHFEQTNISHVFKAEYI